MIQWRPINPENAKRAYYSPFRDWGVVGPNVIVGGAVKMLDPAVWEDWFRPWAAQHGVTEETVTEAVQVLARAMNNIMESPSPVLALKIAGFFELPDELKLAIFSKLGQVALSAVWAGVRDTRFAGTGTPIEFEAFMDAVNTHADELAQRLAQPKTDNDEACV